jgi:photosystem II stability/assembly factor-like uncharacterized protein
VSSATAALAAPNQWSNTGLQGGPAWGIEFTTSTPGVALLAAGHAIYRTTDSGATWSERRSLVITNLVTFARDPSDPNRLAAVGPSAIPLLTEDGGLTFTLMTRFVPPNGTYENTLAMAANGVWYGGTSEGMIFRSSDRGRTWEAASGGLSPRVAHSVDRLSVDPRNTQRVHALIRDADSNVYTTVDGGASWSLDTRICSTACFDLARDPHYPDRLLAASGTGLHVSSDNGQTWTLADTRHFTTASFDPLVPGRVLGVAAGGITRSVDGGQSWDSSTRLPTDFSGNVAAGIAFDLLQRDRVLLTTRAGVFFSEDAGATWVPRNSGINGAVVTDLISLPAGAAPARSFAVGASEWPGLLAYDPAVQRWALLGSESLRASAPELVVRALGHNDAAPQTLYAGGDEGLFRSVDGGETWTKSASPAAEYVTAIAVSPLDAQSLYVVAFGDLLYSGDGGSTFVARSAGLPTAGQLFIDRTDPNKLYSAASGGAAGIYRTTNGGVSWQPASSGLGASEIWRVAVDPQVFSTLYAATSTGLWKSSDSGDTWNLLPGNHFVGHVAVDRFDSAHVIRASYQLTGNGFERSLDGGQTWELIPRTSLGLSRGVAFDYTTPSSLMTIVDTGGVETIQIAPDIEIARAPSTIAVSTPVQVVVTNRGPYAASHVVLTASVPRSGTTAQTTRGHCATEGVGGSVRCEIGVLRAEESVVVAFDLKQLLPGDDVHFEAAAREPDPVPSNNNLTVAGSFGTTSAVPPASTPETAGGGGGSSAGGGGGSFSWPVVLALASLLAFRRRAR